MEILQIEVLDPKALNAIKELSDSKMIKVLKSKKLSALLRGSISKKDGIEFSKYLEETRKSW
ncbi:MAG: hypothetical protein U0V04_11835 [Spirosomataceae bacterium]|jgi:hypothetical protein